MLLRKVIPFFLLICVSFTFYSFTYDFRERILWETVQKISVSENDTLMRMSFEGAYFTGFEVVPSFFAEYPIHTSSANVHATLSNYSVIPVNSDENDLLRASNFTDTIFSISSQLVISRKMPYAQVDIVPVRWNAGSKRFEKLISFEIEIEVQERPEPMMAAGKYATSSVLASGDWFKIRVDKSGMFKITYEQLQSMGFNVSSNPANIAIFGNGGGVLPERNDMFRHDDLVENPIEVIGGNDGNFGPGDYLLFYAQGPVVWKYQYLTGNFRHQTNYYDDYSYYYVTVLDYPAARITEMNSPSGSSVLEINEFTDYMHHEIDQRNLAGTGRIFYGEMFDFNSTYQFTFQFPNIISSPDAKFYGEFASMSSSSNNFQIFINNDLKKTLVMQTVSESNIYQIARKGDTDFSFTPSSDELVVKLVYQRSSNSASGYLNFFDLNVKRQLIMSGSQMMFRERVGQSGFDVLRFNLRNADNNIKVWDITDPVNAARVKTTLNGSTLTFDSAKDTLRQFIAFNGQEFFIPEFVEKVANQNLHAVKNIDYVIISHPDFLTQANKLADFHRNGDGMDVLVTTHKIIANEFASGSADITGIRDFMKMLYDVSDPGKEVKYLLLFGDASYDYKGVLNIANSNYVSTWESIESWNIVNSVASDDYYGYLDEGEGEESASNKVDIGIGRFVVSTQAQADMAVNKSIFYATNTPTVMEPWRNMITFVADDGDNNLHMQHAEQLSEIINTNNPVYNIDKIYVDAYKQISTPSGQRAPDVNQSLNDRMEKGTLIVNYSGHGGEIGWGHEQFLQNADINSWTNINNMPIFITATCEFSRYDDPTRVSAGELVFLNSKGGAVALFSTARATFASSNLTLNKAIYEDNIFEKDGGEYPRFGDIIRKAKKQGNSNDKKFILIGDPALRLAYPEHTAKTISINGKLVSENTIDTINALSRVKIVGEIVDANGNKLNDFNGIIFPTIYDKESEVKTFGDQSNPTSFSVRKNVLFNGQASIDNGDFSFEYIVPKDIAYKYGNGRISYYFRNNTEDGNGYYDNLVIGGYDQSAPTDNEGPEVILYMNDTTFQPGGTTNESPVLLAIVNDESGINTTGNGIGHDIIATLDEQGNSYTLNNYYEAQRDSYKSGRISYPLSKLSEGPHTISLKVWDIYNNSTTATLNFTVVTAENFVIENLVNYPNPFSNETSFVFDHNQAGQTMQVNIRIYSLDGKLVRNLNAQISSESYQSEPITWNATNEGGSKISPGMYMYKVVVQNESGASSVESSKMIYLQ
ncbi:MAG TPA: type IX secretion system sortase PorU [Bacteroidales bacterium]